MMPAEPTGSGGSSSSGDSDAPLLSLDGIVKSFGAVRALDEASMTVSRAGVGHALIGTNGSGKSTLLGVLSGQLQPNAGTLTLGGRALHLQAPIDAIRCGVVMVAQETAVAPNLTVAENMFLGHRMKRGRFGIDWGATVEEAAAIMARLDPSIDVTDRVGDLRPGRQQITEIARALTMQCRVLILDEPTSSLTEDEVESVSAAIERVKALGTAVILVSHRFEEIFSLCEEVTVLRDGVTVMSGPLADQDADALVAKMVGKATALVAPKAPPTFQAVGSVAPRLRVRSLSAAGSFTGVDCEIQAGELVGITGLVGSGRSELLRAIFGDLAATGEVWVDDRQVIPTPRRMIDRGVGYVPPDRKSEGLVLSQTVAENLAMVKAVTESRWRRPRTRDNADLVTELGGRLKLRAPSPDLPVGSLSGGNQQKISLGKWLAADARLLLLDEPTRGVDVEAKAEIHDLLRGFAAQGVAMFISSSESAELHALCHRVLVMTRGRVVADLSAEELESNVIASHAGGQL